MSDDRRRLVPVAAGAAALMTVAAALLLAGQGQADASALSRGNRGWLAARRYLEETGCRVALLDHDLEAPIPAGVLVVSFPWQSMAYDDVAGGLDRHLQTGGDVVFAYSGNPYDPSETGTAEALGLVWDEGRKRPPLNPLRWRRHAAEEWTLMPQPPERVGRRPARVSPPRRVPRPPEGATVLARGPEIPAVFLFRRWSGRVVAVPADVFANARLAHPGNADLLETLRQSLGDKWAFDEFHHGLRPPVTAAESGPPRVLVLYVLQIGFLYLLAVAAVACRFGPAWSEPAVTSGSAATFLLGLGTLHDRLGHHPAAARLLLARAREFDGRLSLPPERVPDRDAFLDLARRVGEAQSGRSKSA